MTYKKVYEKIYKRLAVVIGFSVLSTLSFFILPISPSIFIVLRAIMFWIGTAVWVVLINYFLRIYLKRRKERLWILSQSDPESVQKQEYWLSFDNESITISINYFVGKWNWEMFSGYHIHNNALFLFQPGNNYYQAVSFSAREIGAENLKALEQIAASKLNLLS